MFLGVVSFFQQVILMWFFLDDSCVLLYLRIVSQKNGAYDKPARPKILQRLYSQQTSLKIHSHSHQQFSKNWIIIRIIKTGKLILWEFVGSMCRVIEEFDHGSD
eukprot:TRINITY_DN97351_c0_g1_i1.p2 TRINITY_DN97351_c0_g1~~TRINITY_DN97351_c0_g1_i1.p2  ORF type:complete len:104 (-),score=0.22 TRINITY_DN97351_c0_g1_i1:47-358(-)